MREGQLFVTTDDCRRQTLRRAWLVGILAFVVGTLLGAGIVQHRRSLQALPTITGHVANRWVP
jgi:hypothetical protein